MLVSAVSFVRREGVFSILMAWGLKQFLTLLVRVLMFLQCLDGEGWLFLSWEGVWIILRRAEFSDQQSLGAEGRSRLTFPCRGPGRPSSLFPISRICEGHLKLLTTSTKGPPGAWWVISGCQVNSSYLYLLVADSTISVLLQLPQTGFAVNWIGI